MKAGASGTLPGPPRPGMVPRSPHSPLVSLHGTGGYVGMLLQRTN